MEWGWNELRQCFASVKLATNDLLFFRLSSNLNPRTFQMVQKLEGVFIHYVGWDKKWDQWIFIIPNDTICDCSGPCTKDNHRLASPNTQSKYDKDQRRLSTEAAKRKREWDMSAYLNSKANALKTASKCDYYQKCTEIMETYVNTYSSKINIAMFDIKGFVYLYLLLSLPGLYSLLTQMSRVLQAPLFLPRVSSTKRG